MSLTKFYERDGITIYCGDCLEVMRGLDGPFDAIIADLPYGTTACSWDTVIPFEPLWEQYKRLAAGAVVLFGSQPFTSKLVMSCLGWFKYEWIWRKIRISGFLNANRRPLSAHENILVFGKGKLLYNPQMTKGENHKRGRNQSCNQKTQVYGSFVGLGEINTNQFYPQSCVTFRQDRDVTITRKHRPGKIQRHPTQKPVALLAYLIRTYTNPGEIVLDNTMGSGTTLVAAQREGRRCTGIEISEEYCKIAVERLRQRSLWQIPSPETEEPKPRQVELEFVLNRRDYANL